MATDRDARGGRGSNQYQRKPRDQRGDSDRVEMLKGLPPPRVVSTSGYRGWLDVDTVEADDPTTDPGPSVGQLPDSYIAALRAPEHPAHGVLQDDARGEELLTADELAYHLGGSSRSRVEALMVVAYRGSEPLGETLSSLRSARRGLIDRAVGSIGM